MNGRLGWMLGLAAVAFLAAGCPNTSTDPGSGTTPTDSTELTAMAHPYINEVPVPLLFKYKEDKSRSDSWDGGRYIDHFYTGSADKYAVARFYRKQMPLSGWAPTPTPEHQGQGVVDLAYERAGESCRIMIYDGGLFVGTEIHVRLTPNPQAKGPPPPRNK